MAMTSAAAAPRGMLSQKHHLQETLVVKTPPSTGPRQAAVPAEEAAMPMNSGRLYFGTVSVRISNIPGARSAAPMPAVARPMMNIIEEFASAHINEPTDFCQPFYYLST